MRPAPADVAEYAQIAHGTQSPLPTRTLHPGRMKHDNIDRSMKRDSTGWAIQPESVPPAQTILFFASRVGSPRYMTPCPLLLFLCFVVLITSTRGPHQTDRPDVAHANHAHTTHIHAHSAVCRAPTLRCWTTTRRN